MDNMGHMQYLSEMLARLLTDQRRTQAELARFAKITQGQVANHIKGTAYPKVELLIKYARFFKVTVEQLTGNPVYSVLDAADPSLSEEAVAFCRAFDSLPTDDPRRRAIRVLLEMDSEDQVGGSKDS